MALQTCQTANEEELERERRSNRADEIQQVKDKLERLIKSSFVTHVARPEQKKACRRMTWGAPLRSSAPLLPLDLPNLPNLRWDLPDPLKVKNVPVR